MANPLLPDYPNFAQELVGTVTVHSQFVLYGNIRDQFLLPPHGQRRPVPILQVLFESLQSSGYQCLLVSDQVDGITVYPKTPENRRLARQILGFRPERKVDLEQLRSVLARVVGVKEPPPIQTTCRGITNFSRN